MAAPEGDFGGESSDGPISCAETVVLDRSVPGEEVAWGIPGMVSIVDGIVRGGTLHVAASALLFALFERLLSPSAVAMVWIEIALFVK